MAAGNVVLVLVIAAIVGSLLNAAGIRKTANGQPVGVRRDVARFFAEPLYDISHALQIDELRKGVQAIAGRSGDDNIRNERYRITVECFDRMRGLNFKQLLERNGISTTVDIKSLHPTEVGWNRKFTP